ncbi:MAG: HlyC/CorC family transporter [Bacteroidetes bacterium]|nr:MAG: HlyC/CorC family transporter [Bacteroidota bacterium]
MDYNNIPIVLVSLLFSAMFSGVEIAFVSSDKLYIELLGQQGTLAGKILSRFSKKPAHFIATTLVGNTVALVIYGIFMAAILEPILHNALPEAFNSSGFILLAQTLGATLVVLITAEFTPKSLFLLNPHRMLKIFALPMQLIYWLMQPVVFVVVTLSKIMIVKVLRLEYSEDEPVFGLTDLNNYLHRLQENPAEDQVEVDTKIFNNALEFKTVKVRECMIPRTEIVAVDFEDGLEELKKAFIDSGHSKILIYKETIDDIIGYCSSQELFKKPKSIADILTPIIIVPETLLANELMIQFINERKSLALVMDEFGGTSGIVSIEDIIEEIFGEIQDEHDDEDLVEQKLSDNTYLLSARHEVDYLNEKYLWNIPEGDYDTLGGYILSVHEDIPNLNQIIEIPPFTFTITSIQETRIDVVRMSIQHDSLTV